MRKQSTAGCATPSAPGQQSSQLLDTLRFLVCQVVLLARVVMQIVELGLRIVAQFSVRFLFILGPLLGRYFTRPENGKRACMLITYGLPFFECPSIAGNSLKLSGAAFVSGF